MLPSVGISKPAMRRSKVVLPQPDGPEKREELVLPDGDRNIVQGANFADPSPENFAYVFSFDSYSR